MKIFVTGVAGLLGSNIARRLTKDHKIVGCDTFIGGLKDNVPDCQFYEIDILDTKAMTKAMEDCEMVIHTAALPYEGLSVFSPAIVTQNIVGGTVSVASAALANGTDMFINFSSIIWTIFVRPTCVLYVLCSYFCWTNSIIFFNFFC